MSLPPSTIGAAPRSHVEHQHARFRAAIRLARSIPWFTADVDAPEGAPADGSVIGPDAALCRGDATEHGVELVTPETIDRYLVLEMAPDDHRTCLAFALPKLPLVQRHIEESAESAEALLAVYDLDLERQVPVGVEVVVTATFPTHREWVTDAPVPPGPRVIATLVLEAWVGGNAVEIDEGRLPWDATPQIERMGRVAALALEDNRAGTDALVPPELLGAHTGPYRVEIAEAIPEYFAALDAAARRDVTRVAAA